MKTFIYRTLCALFLLSCSKQNHNNRKFAGNWELENINIKTFANNEETSSKDTTYYGVMQLQNGQGVVEAHDAYFTGFVPFPTSFCHWEVSTSKAKTIRFFLWNVGVINYSYSYNVEKITSRKMILTSYTSDDDLNLLQKTTLSFIKK